MQLGVHLICPLCPCATAAQQRVTAVLARTQHAVSPAERDAAVQQAVATERALAAAQLQRADAAWRERLGVLERQLAHQSAEVAALRAANEKLELAVGTLKVRLAYSLLSRPPSCACPALWPGQQGQKPPMPFVKP